MGLETTTRDAVRSQYLASLAMLGRAIEGCPEHLWTADATTNPCWQVAYHALFFAHLYLQPTERDFVAWYKHRPDYQVMGGRLPCPPFTRVAIGEPYTREEVLEYLEHCRAEVSRLVPVLDLEAPSGFPWLPFGKLELQLYSIRHIQLHAGELAERLGAEAGVEVGWVGMEPPPAADGAG